MITYLVLGAGIGGVVAYVAHAIGWSRGYTEGLEAAKRIIRRL